MRIKLYTEQDQAYFFGKAHESAQNDAEQIWQKLKSFAGEHGSSCFMQELELEKQDVGDSVSYNLSVIVNHENAKQEEVKLPKVTFNVSRFPSDMKERLKQAYVKAFEEAIALKTIFSLNMPQYPY